MDAGSRARNNRGANPEYSGFSKSLIPGCFGPVNAESYFDSIPVLSQSRLKYGFAITNLIDLEIETSWNDALKVNFQFLLFNSSFIFTT